MNARVSVVKNIKILDTSASTIVHIGDAVKVKPRAKVIEVEREVPSFIEKDANFSDYAAFTIPIPQPTIQEDVQMTIKNKSSWIKVNQVNIRDISVSSVFQVGSNKSIDTESRYKHIRQVSHNKTPETNR